MIRLLWVLLAGSLLCLRSSAQSRFDSWTIDNGLPQNSVYSILQTRDGYLWFTTLNGLVRYDGARFTVFNKSNSPGINGNRFTTLYEDPEGVLWIGTEGNGLTRYKGGSFTSYMSSANTSYNTVYAIQGGLNGNLWILTGGGLARWHDEMLTPDATAQVRLQDDLITNKEGYIKSVQRHRGITSADASGVQVFSDGELKTYTTREGLSSRKVNSLYQDSRGDLWAGTEDAGLNRLHNGKFTVYRMKDGLPSDQIRISAVCEDRRGNLWLALVGSGLCRLKGGTLTRYTAAAGLSGDLIQTIYEDREGSIWIGTSDGGLNRVKEEVISVYSKRNGLFANNTYPVYQDRQGSVWIGTWPGLNKYKDGKFTHYTLNDGMTSQTVTSLYEDRQGALWVGTYGGGVLRFKDGRFTTLKGLTGAEANGILAILQDKDGTLWFGTTSGLFKYQGGVLSQYKTDDGLPHPQVMAIHEDREGNLWLGTRGGIARLQDKIFTVYTEKEGLSSNHVRSFYEDDHGVLWIGTYDGGLNRLKDGRFTHYTFRDGMFDDGVFQILNDGVGNCWMSSNRGVYRVNHQQLDEFAEGKISSITSIGYGRSDGMLNAECNGGMQPAGIRARDGRLWFPTQEGVAVIDPAAIHANLLAPPVLIEEFTLDNQKIALRDGGVRIAPGQTRFEIRYTGLSYIKPEQVRFKYKLEGLEQEWVDAGALRMANYSYVPPGSYTFRVIAANSDGVWNTEGASLPVVVHPPFWRTWWFLSLASLMVIGTAVLWYKRRLWGWQQAQATQAAFSRRLIDSQENERKRIAAELHDSLGQSLVIIKNRAVLGLNAPENHERALEQLDEIAEMASDAIYEVKDIAYNLRPFQLDRLGLTQAIESMLKTASDSHGIQFSASIDEIDGAFSQESEINLYRIVQESVNNIIKHSAATQGWVKVKRDGHKVEVTIQDNGQGFVAGASNLEEGTKSKFGLIGISERARILGAKHEIRSLPGEGTTIRIKFELTEGVK